MERAAALSIFNQGAFRRGGTPFRFLPGGCGGRSPPPVDRRLNGRQNPLGHLGNFQVRPLGIPGLFRRIGHVNKAAPSALTEQGIIQVIAHIGARGKGRLAGNARRLSLGHHFFHRQIRKIRRRAFRGNGAISPHFSCVVRGLGMVAVNGAAFHAYPFASPRLTAQYRQVGIFLFQQATQLRAGFFIFHRYLRLHQSAAGNFLRQRPHRFPGRIDRFAAEGFKARHQNPLHFLRSPLCVFFLHHSTSSPPCQTAIEW